MKKLIKVEEAAYYLGTSVAALYQRVHRRQLPYVKIRGSLRFNIEKLNEFILTNSIDIIDYDRVK